MIRFYKFIFILLLTIGVVNHAELCANHLTGGSMSYEYVNTLVNGNHVFRITTEIYRDDRSGGAEFDNPLYITIFNLDNSSYRNKRINLFSSQTQFLPINDLGPCAINVPIVSIQKASYTFLDTISLNNNGYMYSHQRCCRSDVIFNLNDPGNQGSTYSVHISRNAMLIRNSNPDFNQEPPLLICVGSNFEYQFTATDVDGHRLRYFLCSPDIGGASFPNSSVAPTTMSRPPYTNVTFKNGYSATEPFGENVDVDLDPVTGILKLRPDRVGIFTIGVCVEEFDANNNSLGIIKRDIQFNIANCIVPAAVISPPIGANMKDDGSYATCKGLNNTFIQNSTGAQSYFWDFGIPNITDDTSTARTPVFAFPDSGTFEIKLIINKGQICADSITFQLSVYPTLNVDFDFQTFCEFLPVSLQSTSTSTVDPIIEQSWSYPNNSLFTGDQFQHTFPSTGPYPVKLLVETQNGCKDSIIKNITLPKFTEADFNIVNGIQQNQSDTFVVCSENIIRLSNLLPNNIPFIWKIHNTTSTDQNPIHTFSDSGTYFIQLIANPNTPCADTLSKWARVIPAPVADFSHVSYCAQFPVEFTTVQQRNFDPFRSVTWNFGDGITSTEFHPKKQFDAVKNYNITQYITTQAGCKDTIQKTITVNPDPVADFNITGEIHNQQYLWCDDKLPIEFQQKSIQAQTFEWTFGNNLSQSTSSDPTYTFPAPGEYNVQLIINKGQKCTDTIVKTIKTIDGISKIDFSIKDICVNTQQTFTNQSIAVKNDFSAFKWDFGNGSTSIDRNPILPYSNPGTYTIKMIAETALGCKDSVVKNITIYPAPTVNFDNSDVCPNVEHIFNNTSTISSGKIDKYLWTFGSLGTSTEVNAPFTFSQAGNINVRLTATSDLGCNATINKTVKIRPEAKVDFDYTNHCYKAPVFFTDKSTSANNDIVQWIWTFESGKSAIGKNVNYTYSKAGTYEVTLVVISNIGCRDSVTESIIIEDIPAASFNIAGNDEANFTLFSCNGDYSVVFENTSDTGLKYLWQFGWNNITSTDRDGYFVYPDSGSYVVRLTTESGTVCQDFIEKKVRVIPPVEFEFEFSTECVLAPVYFKSIYKRDFDPIVKAFWSFGDGTTSTEFNPEKKYTKSGSFNVELTLTASSGCSATISKSITIHPEPIANFVADGIKTTKGEFLKCENLLGVTFKNTSTLNNSNNWFFNDNNSSSTEIAPIHYFSELGSYDVTLIINQGKICSDTITKKIDIVHGIDTVDFDFDNACVLTDISFKDLSKALLNDIDTYLWNFGDNTTSTLKNPTKSYTLPGDYLVKLYVTTKNGCIDSTQKTITIYPAPQSMFDVNQACLMQEITIQNTSTILSGSIAQSSWDFGNNTNQNSKDPTIKYSSPGFYTVQLTSTSDFGCINTYQDIIEIKEPSLPKFSYTNQCVSAPVEFKDESFSIYNDIVAWEWKFTSNDSSKLQNPIFKYSEEGTYPVQLYVITSLGCKDSITQNIILKPHPIADLIIDAQETGEDIFVYCDDDKTISFKNQSIDNLTNLWSFGNTGTSNLEDVQYTFPDTGSYNILLTINSGTLCMDSKSVKVNIQPTLTVDFTYPTICEENAVVFNDQSSIASNDIISRDWKIDTTETSGGRNLPYTFDQYGNYNVQLIVKTAKGCIDSMIKNVKVEALPIVNFNISEACPQQATHFQHQSLSVNNNTLNDFKWIFGDGNISTSENPIHTYTTPGSYELTLIVNTKAGCIDSIQEIIIVRDFVEPIITTHTEILCEQEEIHFYSDQSKGVYQNAIWDFGNGEMSNELNDVMIYDAGGSYEVILTLKDALCGEFKISKEISITDVPEIELGPDFALCPNLTTTLDIQNNTLDSIFWNTGDLNTPQIVVKGNVGLVKVEAYYRGCLLEDSVKITPSCEVVAPKVFTPNGDGLNDYFNILPPNVQTYQLYIYNRWGHLVFNTNDLTRGWDGTYQGAPAPMDNYTYYAVGTKTDETPFTIEGAILLLR